MIDRIPAALFLADVPPHPPCSWTGPPTIALWREGGESLTRPYVAARLVVNGRYAPMPHGA